MDRSFSHQTIDLDAACKLLVESSAVRKLLISSLGEKDSSEAITLMRSGDLTGDLGATIHDLLSDVIMNESVPVGAATIQAEHDQYPLLINEYEGIYWIWTPDIDPIGYFKVKADATSFIEFNWGDSAIIEDEKNPLKDN